MWGRWRIRCLRWYHVAFPYHDSQSLPSSQHIGIKVGTFSGRSYNCWQDNQIGCQLIAFMTIEFSTGRMKVNLRRFEDLKIRLKKSSKMEHLREGISRTDLQIFISSKIIGDFIFKSSYLRRFPERLSSHLQSSWRLNNWRFIRRLMPKSFSF